ncbi:MAG: flagellar hook-associated protein FlgL [Pseudomonadales bacterium]|nr:flagellar hook-associated protein FlgL [Pseudomonadales bacterium]
MAAIRISTAQINSTALAGMLDVQRAVSKTQEQITTNKRVTTPGDDPIAAARILQLNQELAKVNQFNQNLSTLENRLQREEVALTGVSDLVFRAQDLITQSGNAALNASQRGFIAVELQSVVDGMAQLMNTQDASGEFIFSGFQGREPAFVKGEDGRYVYQGDDGQRSIVIAPGTSVAVNDAGKSLFVDIASREPNITGSAAASNLASPPASINNVRVENKTAFAEFFPEKVVIQFNDVNDVNPPAANFTVRQVSDGRVLNSNVLYTPGEKIEFGGVSVRIKGDPAPGDSFLVESSNKKSLLGGLEDYISQLKSLTDSSADMASLNQQLGLTLDNLGSAQDRLLETRSSVGSRLNQIDSTRSNNEEFELTVRATLSALSDLDIAKAVSQLAQESFVLEAAQASFARVSRLSLFNFI